jgi:hypothetical protein
MPVEPEYLAITKSIGLASTAHYTTQKYNAKIASIALRVSISTKNIDNLYSSAAHPP